MRWIELSDYDSRRKLSDYLNTVLSRFAKTKIHAVLSYDVRKKCFLEFPGMISFEDTMLSQEGYVIILEDHSCLYLKLIGESKIRIGVLELEENDEREIASFSRRDFLNVSEFVYGQGHYRLWTEYAFSYARMKSIEAEKGSHPDGFTSIVFVLNNRKKLIFRPLFIDDKMYTELLPVKLRVTVNRRQSDREKHERVRKYLERRHRD